MINKYGLYKTNVPRSEIPGLHSDRYLDNQTQDWWIPMTDENGDIHMVDTYHIRSGTFNYHNPIKTIIDNIGNDKDYTWTIGRSNWDYYYGGSVKITEQTEKYFVEVCDLRDYDIVKGNVDDYLKKDVVRNVQLWFEHCYPRGVNLLRKNAQKDPTKIVDNCCFGVLDEISHEPFISEWKIREAKEVALNSQDETLIKKLEDLEVLIDKVQALETLKKRFIKEYKNSNKKSDNLVVIGLAGKAGIGKSETSNILYRLLDRSIIIPFAREIKLQAKLFGWNGEKDEKGRRLLQDLTKPIKDYNGQDHYAEIVYKEALNSNVDYLIIDDLRFKAEANYFKNLEKQGKCKFITCKLEKDNFISSLTQDAQNDISENDLNDYNFDYYINNNGTLEDLKVEIEKLVKEIQQ